MDKVYITGHRNPDTDSIVSAIAYAALKTALGQRQYCAARLGQISDETQAVLDRFGVKAPELINNVRTQVRDLDFDRPPCLDASVTMDRAWKLMREQKISAIPVVNEEMCIGCGACEILCPSRPLSANHEEGHEEHREL